MIGLREGGESQRRRLMESTLFCCKVRERGVNREKGELKVTAAEAAPDAIVSLHAWCSGPESGITHGGVAAFVGAMTELPD